MGLISENFLNDPLAGPLRPQDKMLEKKEDEDFGFFDYAGDLALSIPRGIAGAVEGIGEIGNIIPGVNYDIPTNLGLGHSETFAGGAIEGISEFAVGFVPVLGWVGRGAKVGKGMKLAGGLEKAAQAPGAKGFLARRGQEAVAGGITDFMVIQGHEARLSDLIQQFPGLQNPITEFLQSDEEDSEIVGRLKAAVEGIGAGVIFDSMLLGMRALKSGRKAFDDGVAKGLEPEEAAKDAVTEMDRAADFGPDTPDYRHGGEEAIDLIAEAEALSPNPKRKRGSDNIFRRLELEANLIGPNAREDIEGVRTFVRELGSEYFDDLGISIHKNLSAEGRFEFDSRIIRLAKRTVETGNVERVMIHELWHALSDNLPVKDVQAVRKAYQKALKKEPVLKEIKELDEALDEATYKRLVAKHGQAEVDRWLRKSQNNRYRLVYEGEDYRLKNEDEWFAETLADVSQGHLDKLENLAPSRTAKRIFQDIGIVMRDLFVYTKEKLGLAGPEQRIFNDFLRGKNLERTRFGGIEGFRTVDMAAGSGGKPPKTPATRAAGEPDEPEGLPEGDLRSTLEAREGLREEDIIDVETGKLNLRGIEGELKPTIRAVQEVLDDRVDEAVRTSDDDVLLDNLETVASFTGESAETITKRLGADAASTREVNKRVLAYKWIVEAQTQDKLKPALDAVQKALDEDGAVSDELILKASQALTETQGIVQELSGLRTAQSQGLRIFKESEPFMALTKDPDVDAAIRQSRKDILEELGGREEVLKKLRAIRDILENGGGTAAAMEALKKQRNNKWLLAFNEGFINNILGGIKTLTTNFMGPMVVSAYRPMETALGGLVTGNTKVVQRSFRELMGLMTGWRDVAQGARMSILKDEIVFDPSARQVDLPANQRRAISAQGLDIKSQGVGSMVNAIGSVIGMPSRLLGGTDNFVKQLNYRAVVRADLIEQGLERGLRGKDLAEWMEKSMDSMVINGAALTARNLDREANRRGLSGIKKVNWIKSKLADGDIQDRQALATRALEVSREVTFTRQLKEDESVFRSVSQSAQKIVNQHPILRPFIPFIRTPANLLSFAGERTADPVMTMARTLNPLSRTTPKQFSALHGNRSRMMADLASQDPQRKSEAYGRVIAGFGFTATGVMFASTGNLTGGGPKNYKERKLLEEGGWRPYSIKVGDNYFSYQRMDPFASMLGIFADMADIARYAPPEMQEEVESLGLNLGIAVARNIGSKTYLQGVMDLAGLLENPERFVGETARGFAGAMIPNYLGQSVQAVSGDESMREVRTWMDAMQAKIPFLSEGLDPQRNFMGEPMERYMALGGRWTDWFLPIVHSTTSSDPINREIAQLGHAFAPPSAHRYDMDLRTVTKSSGQSAYDRWMELHQEVRIGGRSLNQAMNRLLRSADYRRMSPDGLGDEESPRILEIRKLVQQYRVKAEQQLFREFPDIHQARKNKMITRRGLRTGRTKESIRSSLFPLD